MFSAPSQRGLNYALAGFDRPQMFNMGFVYELPYKTSTSKDVAHLILGDWQINGLFAAVSGVPFTVVADGAQLNMPGGQQTADLVGTYKIVGQTGDAGPWFDPTAFAQPTGVRQGNTGRNQFRGPGYWNFDGSLFRAFPVGGGGKRAEFRAEFFNLFNHPVWGSPDNNVNSSTFGHTFAIGQNGPGGVNGNSKVRDAGTGERQIRLGIRFQF
jgi:hypothetical protein